ncbi:zinc finger protein 596 isoform X1 [Parasteatoda tepidariorum]|nr:zinc finger protein 271 [Parasteatoda tepidariorum]
MYQCSMCSYSCHGRTDMKKHILTHTGERPHICHICGKGFVQKSVLYNDQALFYPMKSTYCNKVCNSYKCVLCSYTCVNIGNMKRHVIVHTGERPYICNLCNKTFNQNSVSSQQSLYYSTRQVLGNKVYKSYKCTLCSYSCHNNTNMKKHIYVHTGERPHVCNVCGRRFTQISHLRVHCLRHL